MRKAPLAISIAALIIATTGTAFAGRYLITSSRQIKPNVARQLHGRLLIKQTAGPSVVVYPTDAPGQSVAHCPAGTIIAGGGWDQGQIPIVTGTVDDSEAFGNGWLVQVANQGTEPGSFRAVAECATIRP